MLDMLGFANWIKRTNSTKRPKQAEIGRADNVQVVFKETTSLLRPSIIYHSVDPLKRVEWSYLYFPQLDRYYFVTDIKTLATGEWQIDAVLDVLATAKAYIANTTAYIQYSESHGDPFIADQRVVSKTSYLADSVDYNNSGLDFSGSLIMLHAGGSRRTVGGMCGVSSFDVSAFNGIVDRLNALYDEFEISDKIKRIYNSPFDALFSLTWIPIKNGTFGSDPNLISLGDYYIGTGQAVTSRDVVLSGDRNILLEVTTPYEDFRRVTMCEYTLFLPAIGIVDIPAESLSWTFKRTSINVQIRADYLGNIVYYVFSANVLIGTYATNISYSLPLSQAVLSDGGKKVSSVLEYLKGGAMIIGGFAAAPFNPVAGIAGVTGGLYQIGNAAYTSYQADQQASVMSKGSISGTGLAGMYTGKLAFRCRARESATVGVGGVLGLPMMCTAKIGNLSGYVKTLSASVACPYESPVRDAINQMLDGGIYYE